MKVYEYTGPETSFYILEDQLDWHVQELRNMHDAPEIEVTDYFREVDLDEFDIDEAYWDDTETDTRTEIEAAVLDLAYQRITAHPHHGTWANDYAPDCPVCGMPAGQDADGEPDYACGHFVGVAQQCEDVAGELALVQAATDVVHVQHDIETRYLFGRSEDGLDAVMTVQEAASRFGREESVVRRACIDGYIPARKSGGTWLIRRADAEARWGKK